MISIIMPTHKKMPYLKNTLMSVVCEGYDDYELIVIDASKEKYFKSYLEEFETNGFDCSRIRVYEPTLYCDKPGCMKTYGLEQATCGLNDYVIFLDHDDFLMHNTMRLIDDASKVRCSDMISGHYVSTYVNNGQIYNNKVSYMNGVDNGRRIYKIWFGNTFIEFSNGLTVYEQTHNYITNMCPTIYKRSVLENNRMLFVKDTKTMDDITKRLMNPFLSETYITEPLYCYCAYSNHITNSTCGKQPSETSNYVNGLQQNMHAYLDTIGFKKDKVVYSPK